MPMLWFANWNSWTFSCLLIQKIMKEHCKKLEAALYQNGVPAILISLVVNAIDQSYPIYLRLNIDVFRLLWHRQGLDQMGILGFIFNRVKKIVLLVSSLYYTSINLSPQRWITQKNPSCPTLEYFLRALKISWSCTFEAAQFLQRIYFEWSCKGVCSRLLISQTAGILLVGKPFLKN